MLYHLFFSWPYTQLSFKSCDWPPTIYKLYFLVKRHCVYLNYITNQFLRQILSTCCIYCGQKFGHTYIQNYIDLCVTNLSLYKQSFVCNIFLTFRIITCCHSIIQLSNLHCPSDEICWVLWNRICEVFYLLIKKLIV